MTMAVYRCICRCHDSEWGVPVSDVVEAAAACDSCRNDHVAVFKPEFQPPKDWKPADDQQADGEGKE